MSESEKYLREVINSKKKQLEAIEAKIMNTEDRLKDQEARRLKLLQTIKQLEEAIQ